MVTGGPRCCACDQPATSRLIGKRWERDPATKIEKTTAERVRLVCGRHVSSINQGMLNEGMGVTERGVSVVRTFVSGDLIGRPVAPTGPEQGRLL